MICPTARPKMEGFAFSGRSRSTGRVSEPRRPTVTPSSRGSSDPSRGGFVRSTGTYGNSKIYRDPFAHVCTPAIHEEITLIIRPGTRKIENINRNKTLKRPLKPFRCMANVRRDRGVHEGSETRSARTRTYGLRSQGKRAEIRFDAIIRGGVLRRRPTLKPDTPRSDDFAVMPFPPLCTVYDFVPVARRTQTSRTRVVHGVWNTVFGIPFEYSEYFFQTFP